MISRPNPLPGPSVDPQERWISLCVDSLYPQMKPWIQSVLDNDYFLSRRYAVVITYFFATCVQYQMVTCARGRLFAWVWMVRAQEHHVTRQNVIPTNRLTIEPFAAIRVRYELDLATVFPSAQKCAPAARKFCGIPSWHGFGSIHL